MATENIDLPGLRIPVTADLAPLGRQGPEAARATEAISRAVREKFRSQLGGAAGRRVVKDFTDAMERQFRVARADITEALARGLITPQEAARRGHQAGEEYQQALLAEIRRRSLAGTLSDRDFVDLTDRLRSVGQRAGREFSTGAQGQLTGLSGWVKGAFATGISVAILGAFRGILRGLEQIATKARETIRLGGEAQQISASFGALATGQGLSPTETLDALQRGSRGLISNLELMRRANAAFRVELPLTAESMGELVEISRRLAKVTGGDATDAFRRLVEGIGKGEPEILDELGLVTRLKDALQAWERQTGRNSDALDQNAKKVIFFNAVMKEAREKVAAMGPEILTADERLTQITTTWENLKNTTAEAIANSPQVSSFLTSLGEDAAASAGKVQDLANHVGALVDTLLDLATGDTAQGIGGWMARALGRQAGVARAAASPFLSALGVDLDAAGDRFAENLARREAEQARQREINDEQNSAALLLRKVKTLQQIEELQRAGAEKNQDTIDSLRREVELIDRRRALLKQARDDDKPTTTPDPLTEAEIKKIDNAREALEARIRAFQALAPLREIGAAPEVQIPDTVPAQLQRIYEIDEEIRQIEQQIAQARGQAPAGIRDVVGALQEERAAIQQNVTAVRDQFEALPRVQAEVAQVVRTLGEMQSAAFRDAGGGYRTLTEGIRAVERATKDAAAAQAELTAAQLSGDPARIAAATKRQADAQERLRRTVRETLALYEQGVRSGVVKQEDLNKLTAQWTELLRAAGIEAEKSTNQWQSTAETIEGVVRGVLSIGDALGVLRDDQRQVLQGFVEIGDAASKIAANPSDVGAWVQGIGGLVSVLQGVLGDDPEAERLVQEHRSAMLELTRALNDLKDAYLHNVSTEQLQTDFNQVGSLAALLASQMDTVFGPLQPLTEQVQTLAEQMDLVDPGATLQEAQVALQRMLDSLGERYGVDLGEFLKRGDFPGLLDALKGLGPAIKNQIEKLGQFDDTVQGVLDRVNFQLQVLGETDAVERLQAINAALSAAGKSAGAFQDELDELSRLDLSTEAGQARRDELVQAMAEALNAGGADTGVFSVEQLRDLITQWAQAAVNAPPTEPPAPTGDLVADTLARVRFELDALGKTDAVERIRATVQALRAAGVSFGEFSDELAALDRLDLSTPEGQAQQASLIAQIVARMGQAGADFGGFTPEALRDLVLEYARARGETAEPGAGETESQGVSRGVTEVTARRQTSLLTTIAYWEEQSGRALQALLQRQYPAGIPSVSPPSPAALGLAPAAGPVTITNEVHTGPVTVSLPNVETIDEATMQRIADTVSAKQLQQIDRYLGEQTRRQQRATGQNTARR